VRGGVGGRLVVILFVCSQIMASMSKKYFSFLLITIIGCSAADESGYDCLNGTCQAVFENPQYLNLTDCQSACSSGSGSNESSTGSVRITATWSNPSPWNQCGTPYTVTVGLGYTSLDVSNESYFTQSSSYSSPNNFQRNELSPGVYYYGAKKVFNSSICGTGQGVPQTVKKTGSFVINENQTSTVSVSLN
jgi:hypothetical protein